MSPLFFLAPRIHITLGMALAGLFLWLPMFFQVETKAVGLPVSPLGTSRYASPSALAICPDQRHALVALAAANSVAVVDLEAGTVIQEIPVGDQPNGVAV
ncbi:MAG: YncE family protein, partial [Gemmataceae bacterium]